MLDRDEVRKQFREYRITIGLPREPIAKDEESVIFAAFRAGLNIGFQLGQKKLCEELGSEEDTGEDLL